jgi:hypothetical protein
LFLELALLQSPPVLNLKELQPLYRNDGYSHHVVDPIKRNCLRVPFCVEALLASIEVKFLLTAVFNGLQQRYHNDSPVHEGGLFLLKYGFVPKLESIDQELLEMFAAKRDYVNRLSLYCRRFVFYRM